MGVNVLEKWLKPNSFLRRHLHNLPLRSVFPATTSAGITSLNTGFFPGGHSLLGWTLNVNDRFCNLLPFTEEDSHGTSLLNRSADGSKQAISTSDVFRTSSLFSKRTSRQHVFHAFATGPYSDYITNKAPVTACNDITHCVEALHKHLANNAEDQNTFSYVYVAEPDNTEHAYGFDSPGRLNAAILFKKRPTFVFRF